MFANLALCFERYRVTGIRIRYRPGSNFVDLVGNGANVYFAPTVGSGQMFVAHMPNDFNGDSWLLNPGEDHWSSHANCKIMSYNKPFDIYYKMAKNVVMTTTGNTFSTNGFQETISPRGTQSIGIGFAGVLTNPSDHFWCGRIFVTYYVTYTHPRSPS